MKRRNFLQLMAALAGVPFLPKTAAKETHTLTLAECPPHTHSLVGTIQPFAGNNVPAGWLPCDGRMIDLSQYPGLKRAMNFTTESHYSLPNLNPRMQAVPDDPDHPCVCGWHPEPEFIGLNYIIKT